MNNLLLAVNWQDIVIIVVLVTAAIYGTYLGASFLSKHFKDDE